MHLSILRRTVEPQNPRRTKAKPENGLSAIIEDYPVTIHVSCAMLYPPIWQVTSRNAAHMQGSLLGHLMHHGMFGFGIRDVGHARDALCFCLCLCLSLSLDVSRCYCWNLPSMYGCGCGGLMLLSSPGQESQSIQGCLFRVAYYMHHCLPALHCRNSFFLLSFDFWLLTSDNHPTPIPPNWTILAQPFLPLPSQWSRRWTWTWNTLLILGVLLLRPGMAYPSLLLSFTL